MATPERILGIDPGLNTTGYAVIEPRLPHAVIIEAGVLKPTKGRLAADMAGRLKALYDGLVEIIEQLKPTTLAIEQLYSHYEHPRTAILMAHARGVVVLAGANYNLSVHSYAATEVKKLITGHGRASKEQMQFTMQRELNLPTLPEPHDVADALAIALCHAHRRKLDNSPQNHCA